MIEKTQLESGYFNNACIDGNLKLVKKLNQEANNKFLLCTDDGYGFRLACRLGHFDVVEYLFDRSIPQNILNGCLNEACAANQLKVVQFLTENSDTYNLKKCYSQAYLNSCKLDSPDILKHLLETFNKQNFDFGWGIYDRGFSFSCEKKGDVMLYFLYDLKFDYDYSVANIIKNQTVAIPEEIEECVKKRDLFIKLNSEFLDKKESFSRNSKI